MSTETQTFIEKAQAKTNKAVTQQAKSKVAATNPAPTTKAKSTSKPKASKVVDGIEYTKVSESTPLEKFKEISDATSTAVTGRRPGFRAWGQLGIKIGQKLYYKNHPEITAIVESEVTNQIKVSIPEEDDFVTFGVIPAEKHVRGHLGSTKNNPQGFDMWGFHLKEDDATKWRSVYDLYCAVFRK